MLAIIYISVGIMILLGITCVTVCIASNEKKKQDSFNQIKIIKADHSLWRIGLGCNCFFLVFTILSFIQKESWYIISGELAFIYLGNFLMYGWLGMVISYDRNGFTVGWFPKIRKYYSYNQLTSYRRTNKGMILQVGKKKISLEYMVDEHYEFQWYALTQYKKEYDQELPLDTSIPKWDIFKGNLDAPEELMIVFGMMIMLCFGPMIFFTIKTYDKVEAEDTICVQGEVKSYYVEKETLILYLEQQEGDYKIYKMDVRKKANLFVAFSENQTFKLYVKKIEDSNKNLYEVYQIEDMEGEVYLSFDETYEFQKEFYKVINIIFCIIILPLLLLFIIPTIIVGRNPEKFSNKVRDSFFQEWAWRKDFLEK